MQYTGRTFQRASYSGLRLNGTGSDRKMMPQNPIISVSSLSVDGRAYSPSADAIATGYQSDEKFLYLFGGTFCRGLRNVLVSLITGYTTNQTGFIPSVTPFTAVPVTGSGLGPDGMPAQTAGPAVVDQGVTYNGAAFTAKAVGSNLSTGQYTFGDGTYTFAAADAGKSVVMSYDFVPGSVEEALLQIIGTWMKRRSTLGVASEALATQTVTYMDKDFPASAKALLGPYRYVVSP